MKTNGGRNITVEEGFASIRATIHGRKKWGLFAISLLSLILYAGLAWPIVGVFLVMTAQQHLPFILQIPAYIAVPALYLYLVYKKLQELATYLFDEEAVEIDEQSVLVEKSGWLGLRETRRFVAEDVSWISTLWSGFRKLNLLSRILAMPSVRGAFLIRYGSSFGAVYNFGNRVSHSDADEFMATVYRRFPKYKYIETR